MQFVIRPADAIFDRLACNHQWPVVEIFLPINNTIGQYRFPTSC